MKIKQSKLVKIIKEEVAAVLKEGKADRQMAQKYARDMAQKRQQDQASGPGPEDVEALMQALKEVYRECQNAPHNHELEASDLASEIQDIIRPFINGQYWR